MTYSMWHKDYNEFVTVFEISDGLALIYSNFLEKKNNNGWSTVKLSKLIPQEHYMKYVVNKPSENNNSSFINNIANSVFSVNSQHDSEKEEDNG